MEQKTKNNYDAECRTCKKYSKCFAADVQHDDNGTIVYYTDVNDFCNEYDNQELLERGRGKNNN